MKRSTIIILAILGILVVWGVTGYNGLVSSDEEVNRTWGNVQNAYQRRQDLIGQLIPVVQEAAIYEKSTLEAVINARASATQMKLDADDLTPEKMQQYQQAQNTLSGALRSLLAVSENYPQLKATEQFAKLQNSIEETENRINKERGVFNGAVKEYNVKVRRFPTVIIAGMMGYEKKPMFESDAGAEKAPDVREQFKK